MSCCFAGRGPSSRPCTDEDPGFDGRVEGIIGIEDGGPMSGLHFGLQGHRQRSLDALGAEQGIGGHGRIARNDWIARDGQVRLRAQTGAPPTE